MTSKELIEIGLEFERKGNMDEALASFTHANSLWPLEIAPYYRLSEFALRIGDNAKALEWADKGLAVDENNMQLWNIRAIILLKLSRYDEAEAAFMRAIALNPENKEVIKNLARFYLMQEQFVKAEAPLRRAAELEPDSALIFNNLGLVMKELGRFDEAENAFDRAITLSPENIEAISNLGGILLNQKRYAEAEAPLRRATELDPNTASTFNNLGVVMKELGRHDEAEEAFTRAITLSPDYKEAISNLGALLLKQKRYAEAEAPLRRAAALDPNTAGIFNNLGLALLKLYKFDEARVALDRAIMLKPDYIEAMSNRVGVLYNIDKFSEAEVLLRKAIEISSSAQDSGGAESSEQTAIEAGAHYNLALVLLSRGDFANGFEEYEWRWKVRDWFKMREYPERPLWNRAGMHTTGHALHGETLLVWDEQGMGDTIHFIRFLNELAKQDCQIVAEVRPELYRLFSASFNQPNLHFISPGENQIAFDMHVPLMSLPRMLGVTYENLPSFEPYLRPLEIEIEDWHGKLKTMTPPENQKKRKIGIVWAGSSKNPTDRIRSMSWETISPLVDAHKHLFQFYSLQIDSHVPIGNSDVIEVGSALEDYAVTAAVVSNLDLVISVDTSIVHLAGAIGKQVWTMLARPADWRWRMDKDSIDKEKTTKWYPSMSLFWQKKPGLWDDVIDEVSAKLASI